MKIKIKVFVTALIFTIIFTSFCAASDAKVYICNQNGDKERASLGDTVSVYADDSDDYTAVWYADGTKYGKPANEILITEELLGREIYAIVTHGELYTATNRIKVDPVPPEIELYGTAGDYSAYLNWTVAENGSPVTEYEISYYPAESPENELGSLTLPAGTTTATITDLPGGISLIIKVTAKNEAGSNFASISLTPNDPDYAAAVAARKKLEDAPVSIHMNLANTKESVTSFLISYFNRYVEYGVKIKDVIITDFKAAVAPGADARGGKTGSFEYIIEIEKGDVRLTTEKLHAEIDNKSTIVYITAEKYNVITGEKLTVSANVLDVKNSTYSWYIASSETSDGKLMQSSDSADFDVPTDKPGDYYIYCVCGDVSSARIKITVSEPFTEVSDIELSSDTITASESEILRFTVYPLNATNNNVIWTIENDGGCLAEIAGRTITAYKSGTVTLKATVENGTAESDYEKIFYVTVKEKSDAGNSSDTDENKNTAEEAELDCSKINGIESITVTVENGSVQITPVTNETVSRLLSESSIESDDSDIIGAVKFVYLDNAIVRDTKIKIKGYDGTTVRILTVNSNGGRNLTEQQIENGIINGNAVSPDTVILLKENTQNTKENIVPYALMLIIPIVSACLFIAFIIIRDNGKNKNRKAKK